MTNKERRQYSRKTLNPLPYINLPSGNGGIVLDVSEQGLRFRSLAPVELSGPIEFSFTAQSNLVRGTGELVWMDEAKKLGGLRFTDLPYNFLEQIRKWPANTSLRPAFSDDLSLHIPAPPDLQPAGSYRGGAQRALKSRIASGLRKLSRESFGSMPAEMRLPAVRNTLAKLSALAPDASPPGNNRWLMQASSAAFLGILILALGYAGHRRAGELLVRLGTKLSGQAAASAPTVAPQAPRVDDGLVEQANAAESVLQPLPQPVHTAPAEPAKEISAPAPVPPVQVAPARPAKSEIRRGDLVVQVAALTQESDARELTEKLHQENFQAFVGTLPTDSFFRVMLGPYPDAASARTMIDKLKKAGFNSFIRRESGGERSESLGKAAPRQEPAT
jgi:cell division septation protein DedD